LLDPVAFDIGFIEFGTENKHENHAADADDKEKHRWHSGK